MDRFERISKMVEIVEENCGRKLRRRRKRNVVTMPGQSVGRYDVGNSVQVAAAPLHPSPSLPETQTSGRSYELFQWVYRSYSLAVSWLPLALSNLRIYIKHEWPPLPLPRPHPSPPSPPRPTIARKLPRTVKTRSTSAMETRRKGGGYRFLHDRFTICSVSFHRRK